jgi:dUTP pyrophosphatase
MELKSKFKIGDLVYSDSFIGIVSHVIYTQTNDDFVISYQVKPRKGCDQTIREEELHLAVDASSPVIVKYKKMFPEAKEPFQRDGDACFDLYSSGKYFVPAGSLGYEVKLGVGFEMPSGYHMQLFMRSSTGSKTSLRLSNCVGVIDNAYRGEVKACFDNIGNTDYTINKDDRLVQGLLVRDIPVTFEEVDNLSDTERGTGGFGSTGQ